MTAVLQALLALCATNRLSVLTYHRVMAEHDAMRPGEPTAAEFESRMRWVASNFDVLSLEEGVRALRAKRLPKRALAITFDDGYADNYELALPILKQLALPATFFIATGYLDGGCMFNDIVIETVRHAAAGMLDLQDVGLPPRRIASEADRLVAIDHILSRLKYYKSPERHDSALTFAKRSGCKVPDRLMMSSQQVGALAAAGMTLGAHTVTHPILAEIPLDIARDEIVTGRKRLEAMSGRPVRLFAYPNGKPGSDYLPAHAALVRNLGFEGAVSTAWGAARAGDDIFQIPRFTPWDRPNWRFGLRLLNNRRFAPAVA